MHFCLKFINSTNALSSSSAYSSSSTTTLLWNSLLNIRTAAGTATSFEISLNEKNTKLSKNRHVIRPMTTKIITSSDFIFNNNNNNNSSKNYLLRIKENDFNKRNVFTLSSSAIAISNKSRTFSPVNENRNYSKFTVRDPHTIPAGVAASGPLTEERAYELLLTLSENERHSVKKALERYEAKRIKEDFEGKLAATRWRSRFGRPARMPTLGEVDPTGSYCAVPSDWLRKKSVEQAKPPTTAELWKIFSVNAVPFVGFGFLDNFTMIIAGDYIEGAFGAFMCISTMAAAGLGNTISDVLGIGSAYYVERLSEMLGLRPPDLTPVQLEMKSTRRSANMGRIVGITVGCLVGMFPLLFMDMKRGKTEEESPESSSSPSTTDVAN